MRHSNLPGPRANLELAAVASDVATAEEAARWAASDDEYLAVCGAMASARFREDARLRRLANDARWRAREGVVLGLQRHAPATRGARPTCSTAGPGQRPGAPGGRRRRLAEPALLRDPILARAALDVLERVTAGLATAADRRADGFRACARRSATRGACVAARVPGAGASVRGLLASDDPDVRWVGAGEPEEGAARTSRCGVGREPPRSRRA